MASTTTVLNGNVNLLSSRQGMAGAAKYFTVTNPTPGTAIVWATITGYSATANGLFLIRNTAVPGGPTIYLDKLSLRQTATAPTGTLSLNFDVWNETGLVTATGNAATRTPVQLNQGASTSQVSVAGVQSFAAGAMTIPAAVGTRQLSDIGWIPTGVTVQHDEFVINFGSDGPATSTAGLTAARATAPARLCTSMNPIVVAPQTTSWINAYWTTQAANVPSLEFSLGWVEL